MPNAPVAAAAEGLPEPAMNARVSRRKILSASASAAVAAVVAGEAVAETLADLHWEQVEKSGATELPVERCTRLACELAEALNDYDEGQWSAQVLPAARGGRYSVMFKNLHASDLREAELKASMQTLVDLMKGHRDAFWALNDVCYLDDNIALGREPTRREKRIFAAADEAETAAFMALCAHRCRTIAEHEFKTRYLQVHRKVTGATIEADQLDEVFDSSIRNAGELGRHPTEQHLAWVRQMRADGFVFVANGHPCDLAYSAIRRDLTENDDTARYIAEIERRLRCRHFRVSDRA